MVHFRRAGATPSGRNLVRVLEVNGIDEPGTYMLRSYAKDTSISDGMIYEGEGTFSSFRPKGAPWDFDRSSHWRRKGIRGELDLLAFRPLRRAGGVTPKLAKQENVRRFLSRHTVRLSPYDKHRRLLRALLLGDSAALDPETRRLFARAGIGHVLAVSGLHVGLVFGLLTLAFRLPSRWLGGRIHPGTLSLAPLSVYAWISGSGPSVQRALLMCCSWVASKQLRRKVDGYAVYSLALFLSLAVQPALLFSLGFQLSFTAVLAIIWGHKRIREWLRGSSQKKWVRSLIRTAWLSLCAQLGTLPLVMNSFGFLSLLFLPANLILLPALPLLLGLGFIGLLSSLAGWVPDILTRTMVSLLEALHSLLEFTDRLPSMFFYEDYWNTEEVVLAYGVLLTTALFLEKPLRVRNRQALLFTMIAVAGYGLHIHRPRPEESKLWIVHRYQSSELWVQQGRGLSAFRNRPLPLQSTPDGRLFRKWQQSNGLEVPRLFPLGNTLRLSGERLLVSLDRDHWSPPGGHRIEVLWLRDGSWVHLGKVLEESEVGQVVADGSSPRSAIERWEQTCRKRGVPFHRTDRDGYFTWELN